MGRGSLPSLGLLALVVLITRAAPAAAAPAAWRSCGEGALAVRDATLTPDTVSPGTEVAFAIAADLAAAHAALERGTVSMLVKLAGLPIYTETDDLCDKTACPVAPGAVARIVYHQLMPEVTPPGPYSVTLRGTGPDEEPLFCVVIDFRVVPASAPPAAAAAGGGGALQAS